MPDRADRLLRAAPNCDHVCCGSNSDLGVHRHNVRFAPGERTSLTKDALSEFQKAQVGAHRWNYAPLPAHTVVMSEHSPSQERAADQPFQLGCGRTSVESARGAHLQSDGKRIRKRYRCAVSSARDFGLLCYDCFCRSSHNYIIAVRLSAGCFAS
jgi:hypothetical protein